MEVLFSINYKESMVLVWKGIPAAKQQRPMSSWYEHCSALAATKHKHPALYKLRMTVVKKWFATKDSTFANIYRHYHEVETRW